MPRKTSPTVEAAIEDFQDVRVLAQEATTIREVLTPTARSFCRVGALQTMTP